MCLNKQPKPKTTEDIDTNIEDEGEGNEEREETEDQKKETAKIKTYFKNRYISFLKGLKEDNLKKKEEEEKARQKEERLRNKMLQKFGIENVRSRFMSETTNSTAAIVTPPVNNDVKVKRSASIANRQKPAKPEMSKTTYPKNVGTPKNSLRNRLNEVKEFDEKLEEERKIKEQKNKKEAAERIKKKQEDYLKSLVEKKRLEGEKEEEERK